MFKKNVLGLTILAAGFLLWSCGDGSIDPLSDSEIMMISRFPSTIDYDMLDSIVKACEKDEACWEKAKKTGEIYKGDYTKVLRDSSGNIVVVEGDSAYTWKDGKKLPVFNFSSNSNDDDDDDVTSSGSTATSGSSSKESSASGYDVDEYTDGGDGPDSNGSGSGGTSVSHDRSSSSKKSTSSSSIDLSFLNSSSSIKVLSSTTVVRSSSSKKTTSSSSVDLSFLSSSTPPEVERSSATVVESSSSKTSLSAGSESSQGGGGGSGGLKCGEKEITGTCKPNKDHVFKGDNVTYTYVPAAGSCDEESAIHWLAGDSDASVETQDGGWNFTVSFSRIGPKITYFIMDNTRIPCDDILVETNCNTPNTYSCTNSLISTSNNLTKSNPVKYKWTLSKSGCYDVLSVAWNGPVVKDSMIATGNYSSVPSSSNVFVSVVDESGNTPKEVNCPSAVVRNMTEAAPSCSVVGKVWATGESLTIAPKSISGCDYDNDKCGYVLRETSGGNIASSSSGYDGGSLSIVGESTANTVNYTLTLSNKIGSGSCTFDVEYVDATSVTATTSFIEYTAGGVYKVTKTNSSGPSDFVCLTNTAGQSGVVVGTIDEVSIKACSAKWCGSSKSLNTNSAYIFLVSDDAPSDLKCGLSY